MINSVLPHLITVITFVSYLYFIGIFNHCIQDAIQTLCQTWMLNFTGCVMSSRVGHNYASVLLDPI